MVYQRLICMGTVTPPTRHPKWVSSEGVTLRDCDCLTFSFSSFRADTYIHMHNLCNNKNSSFYIYIIHTTIVSFIIFFTPILESIYLYYYNFTITYKIRDCGTVR